MTNATQARAAEQLDRRSLSRKDRSAARARFLAVETRVSLARFLQQATTPADRIDRLRAMAILASAEYAAIAGPERAVALHGARAGICGGDIQPKTKARADADKVFGGGE